MNGTNGSASDGRGASIFSSAPFWRRTRCTVVWCTLSSAAIVPMRHFSAWNSLRMLASVSLGIMTSPPRQRGGLMRENGLRAQPRRRFQRTTDSGHRLPVAPNLLARCFTATAPNEVWVGDITYIWTAEGWSYLAVLLDLYYRRVVGWALRKSLARDLAIATLRHALSRRRPPAELMHHTDRGCQYASAEYRLLLDNHGAECSMSRADDCWDNAVAESFFATLKKE